MTPLLSDILETLDRTAPFSGAEGWDNPGLQVGFRSDEIKRVFVSLDPTIEALRRAAETDAQLLLTHHPLIFEGIKNIDPKTYPGDVITEAIASRVSIVAVHTNLDTARGGINDILAGMIGLDDMEALVPREGSCDRLDGLGRIGYLPEAAAIEEIARNLMDATGCPGYMITGDRDRKIRRVAILGGAGGSELSLAARKGADLYITGDIRHHEALMARSLGISLIDAGHFSMERAAMHVFADHLGERFRELGWDVGVEIFRDETAPMRYLDRRA